MRSMQSRFCVVLSTFVLALLFGCTSTKMSDRDEYEGDSLPRPGRIIVYDFAATPADLPAWSRTQKLPSAPISQKELDAGRKLGGQVAEELVRKIKADGLTAVRSAGQGAPNLNDIVLIGYFTSVDTGSGLERVVIGFGQGAAQVNAHAEGYHMTEDGLELLGSGTVESGGGGKMPGLVVPASRHRRDCEPHRTGRRRRRQGGG